MGIGVDFEQQQNLVHRDANSYRVMYAHYRHQWPNYILMALILAGEVTIAFGPWKRWITLRQYAVQI